jgi:hypothetical protein
MSDPCSDFYEGLSNERGSPCGSDGRLCALGSSVWVPVGQKVVGICQLNDSRPAHVFNVAGKDFIHSLNRCQRSYYMILI